MSDHTAGRSATNLWEKLAAARTSDAQQVLRQECRDRFPTLWLFLTRVQVTEDLDKDVASVSIRLGLGEWLVELTDPGFEVSLCATSSTLVEALDALERALQRPDAPIRPWKGTKGKLRARPKKKDQQTT